jgi:DUF1365 family protein
MQSCIYEGQVRHSRAVPVVHRFCYRLFLMYIDLGELPELFEQRWFWSSKRPALARFRRENYLGPVEINLDDAVRDLVESETGSRPPGPVRMLTNLSYFGYCFNPVTYYYCYDESGRDIEAIVAEVTNTPWKERTTYVLPAEKAERRGSTRRFSDRKSMHVSPFMPMDINYDWCFTTPAQKLTIYMANQHKGKRVFDASLTLKRTEISSGSLARVLVSYPFMTAKVMAAIHWEALKLWLKGCPVHEHPDKRQKIAVSSR